MKSEEYELYFQELLCTLIGHYENVLLCCAELRMLSFEAHVVAMLYCTLLLVCISVQRMMPPEREPLRMASRR